MIVAADSKNGIGKDGSIPWKISEDLIRFKKLTENHVVIMGRKTWESLPHKPLKNRTNVVLTSNMKFWDAIPFSTLDGVLNFFSHTKHVFIIGGSRLYNEVMGKRLATTIYMTRVNGNFDCDTFINEIPKEYTLKEYSRCEEEKLSYHFIEYELTKDRHQEYEYLGLLNRLLSNGQSRDDRTISLFGEKMEFDLQKGFPLLTTKSVPFKMVYKELLFFLRGQSDKKILQEQNVHISDKNTSRQFLDSSGFQWGDIGAKYEGYKKDYIGQGVDQIQYCIDLIKNDPISRRIIFTGWDHSPLKEIFLHPCHSIVVQFYVRESKYLDCQMYQRSGDCFLGVPFNIASYALLTHMIALITNLEPGKFTHILGYAHIYNNHIEQCETQALREPLPLPMLKIEDRSYTCIEDFTIDSINVLGYRNHGKLEGKMAI